MKGSTLSRRASEFIGVALFAASLIWMIALATYEPSDPVWFFSAGLNAAPANFAGRVGAFLAELSFQLVGYAAYLLPAIFVVVGWHYFWCRAVDARGTKATGAALLLVCVSAFLSLVLGARSLGGKPFRAGGYAGDWLASMLSGYSQSHRLGDCRPDADLPVDHHVDAVLVRPAVPRHSERLRQDGGGHVELVPLMAGGAAAAAAAPRGDREAYEERRDPARDQTAGAAAGDRHRVAPRAAQARPQT